MASSPGHLGVVFSAARPGCLQPMDLRSVTLGGEFGRRVECMVEANILKIDVDSLFLADFCQRREVPLGLNGRYIGLGKFIDSVVRLAYATCDERLVALKQHMIAKLIDAQEPNGYIGVFDDAAMRAETLWDLHEAAYITWAFVSDYRLFGQGASLDAARRVVDFFLARFAADPGLQIVTPINVTFDVANIGWDRALLALSEASGETKYRDFVVNTLKLPDYDAPIRCGTTTFANHAYAHLSHCLAQLDLYRQLRDPRLLRASHKLISFLRQGDGLLVTGSASLWECWHDTQSGLDNLSETCVGTNLARLMDAMLQIEGASLYGDILERTIYNALFAATAPDGSKSRYYTPFEGERAYDQAGNLACCANNNKRFIADLRSWIYYRTERGVLINLYNASSLATELSPGVGLRIEQHTDYPTSGRVLLKIQPATQARFEIKLRIPRWCQDASISVNGSTTALVTGGQFYGLERVWKPGDTVELHMPMHWRLIRGRKAQTGRAAILRGPVVFTFNPQRNAELCARPDFEARSVKIHPAEIEAPELDESVRPGGVSCTLQAWLPGMQPWLLAPRVPVLLTEYADPGGQHIYFTVPGEGSDCLTEDELI
jgi:DUF1680 family protein